MGLFDKLFGKKELPEDRGLPEPKKVPEMPKVKKPRKPREKKVEPTLSAKEKATQAGEPYVSILSVDIDPTNINNGAFELDWNDKFVANLVRAGYQLKKDDTDADMVDRWFADVCKNVIAENYEQWEANQPFDARPRVMDRKDLGDGRTEVS